MVLIVYTHINCTKICLLISEFEIIFYQQSWREMREKYEENDDECVWRTTWDKTLEILNFSMFFGFTRNSIQLLSIFSREIEIMLEDNW